jgi:hypothetical protein
VMALHNGFAIQPEANQFKAGSFAQRTAGLISTLRFRKELETPEFTPDEERARTRLDSRLLSEAQYIDATLGNVQRAAPSPTPGKLVRECIRYRRLVVKNGPKHAPPTTVGTALNVLSRLQPVKEHLEKLYALHRVPPTPPQPALCALAVVAPTLPKAGPSKLSKKFGLTLKLPGP